MVVGYPGYRGYPYTRAREQSLRAHHAKNTGSPGILVASRPESNDFLVLRDPVGYRFWFEIGSPARAYVFYGRRP